MCQIVRLGKRRHERMAYEMGLGVVKACGDLVVVLLLDIDLVKLSVGFTDSCVPWCISLELHTERVTDVPASCLACARSRALAASCSALTAGSSEKGER